MSSDSAVFDEVRRESGRELLDWTKDGDFDSMGINFTLPLPGWEKGRSDAELRPSSGTRGLASDRRRGTVVVSLDASVPVGK